MPLQQTTGNVTTDAYGGGVAAVPQYIEDVFSTYLYTGTGASQTITNGIDLSTKGGLVWTKTRSGGAGYDWHVLVDSARGVTKVIETNLTDAEATQTDLTSFTTTGYNLSAGSYYGNFNFSGAKFVSWTFRKQPKFFDVVTFVKDSSTNQRISHSLGSVPGCIIVKRVTSADDWYVYHRSLGGLNKWISLNSTGAVSTTAGAWGSSAPTNTDFGVSTNLLYDGGGTPLTYVAYVFAHDAGGFGLTGTDNVISCGTFTTNGSGAATISLGYEPQWVMTKRTDSTGPWGLYDTMRGWSLTAQNYLLANDSGAEGVINATGFAPNATGFTTSSPFDASATYIYIAIRRGPMKVPTSGTSVFAPVTQTGNTLVTTNFPVDLVIDGVRNSASGSDVTDRLRGSSTNLYNFLNPYSTSAETTGSGGGFGLDNNNGYQISGFFGGTTQTVMWNFRRAPSFFDEVCYTGTGANRTVTHNLGVAPELMIVKRRDSLGAWTVWNTYIAGLDAANIMEINASDGVTPVSSAYNSTSPTSSVFTVGTAGRTNASGGTYVAYLFATCAGVSKVGSYTGNGSTQTINCGFTGGARFVLIKRTDSTGDWYVYDTARGMTTLTDPYLRLNSTAAESATLGSVTTVSTGFAVNASILAAINTNGASYIFLAIA